MKRFMNKSVGLFKQVQQKPNTLKIEKQIFEHSALTMVRFITELSKRNALIRHKYQGEQKSEIMSKEFEQNTIVVSIDIYHAEIEYGKALLKQSKLTAARNLFSTLTLQIEQIYQQISKTLPDNLLDAYKQLLSEAYTYEGKTLCIGSEEKAIALTKFDQAITLDPANELPKKEKEALLIGRGILPTDQSLVFEKGDLDADEDLLNKSIKS